MRTTTIMLIFGSCLWGCVLYAGAASRVDQATAHYIFEQHQVVTGAAPQQTVLTGFLLGSDVAELAVVSLEENDDRHLRIYAYDGDSWVPSRDAMLRPEVAFVDVINLDGRERLITGGGGRLSWFDPHTASEHKLVAVPADFNVPLGGAIPHLDVTRDLNADNRDDLVVPDVNGFWVYIQLNDGAFAEPVQIGPSFAMDRLSAADGYRSDPWTQSRIHQADLNRDGRSDLVFWDENHFEVHLQDQQGLFNSAAKTFTTGVTFDSDDLASLVAPQGVRHRRRDHQPVGELNGRVLHSLADMNEDGTADLSIFSLQGGSLWSMNSTYEVHFGSAAPDGGTLFAADPDTVIRSDGIPFGVGSFDSTQNGQVGMMFTVINPGVFKVVGMIIGGLLTRSAPFDLDFYSMDGGLYPGKPSARRQIRARTPGKSGGRTFFPSVLMGDVNGDSLADLLVQDGQEALRVFMGVPGSGLFARWAQKVAVAMPHEEYTWLVDLNQDGKQDLLMHHPSTTEPHRVTMLIAR